MELLDVYDKDGNKKGITVFRGEYIRRDDYILVVHIYIYNSKNEFLIQKNLRRKKLTQANGTLRVELFKVVSHQLMVHLEKLLKKLELKLKKKN